ncbi:MAG: alpha/beta fold hydrolase [Leptolyngbyaceae cyanobacterium]
MQCSQGIAYARDSLRNFITTAVLTQPLASSLDLNPLTWNWQGHRIQYAVAGEGTPLLLLHGFGASIGHWRKNIPVLAAAGYRVFAIDLLGFGGSDKPPLSYSLELWQQLLYDFWSAHIQVPTVYVGNSIGGLLGLIMLAEHGETAAGGILLNCAGGLNHRPDELALPLRVVMGTFTRVVSSPAIGSFLFDRIRQKPRIRRTLYQVYRNREAVTDELVDLIYEPSCTPGAQQVFASVLTAPPGPSPKQLLPRIQVPLLVLWGEADPWTPIRGATIYQEYAKTHPVTFVPIPDTGHCPHDENPDAVNPVMIDWLDYLSRSKGLFKGLKSDLNV